MPPAHTQLQWSRLTIIRPDTWISKWLYKWLVSKVATHPQTHRQGNYMRKHSVSVCACHPHSIRAHSTFSPKGNRGLWERWQNFRFPTRLSRRGRGVSDKEMPFHIPHPWMDTDWCASIFQAYIIQLVSDQWLILQEKNYGSLCYCSQIFTAPSLKNYISLPIDWAWPCDLLEPSELCGKWGMSLTCRSFKSECAVFRLPRLMTSNVPKGNCFVSLGSGVNREWTGWIGNSTEVHPRWIRPEITLIVIKFGTRLSAHCNLTYSDRHSPFKEMNGSSIINLKKEHPCLKSSSNFFFYNDLFLITSYLLG